jgi:hypothetical protein
MSTQDVRENGQTLMGRGGTHQGADRRMLLTPRRVLAAGVVTALALALGAVAVGANPFGTASNPERIDIISRATAINNFVDVGPAGPSPGDIYVFVDDVFLPKAPTTRVGQALGRCTLIDPATARLGCNIRTSFDVNDKDTITSDGTLINTPGAISTGAITGGTGRFLNARGESVLDLGPPEGPHRATFRVIVQP